MYRLLFLLLISCSADPCKTCYSVVETNEAQGILKCAGLPNTFPKSDYYESSQGSRCGDEIYEYERNSVKYETRKLSCDVFITIKSYKKCR